MAELQTLNMYLLICSCVHAKFSDFASWTDSNGNHHTYFSTNTTNKCVIKDQWGREEDFCNCDHYVDEEQRHDTLTITAKELLPLKSFHYGRLGASPHRAAVSIGPLICKGIIQSPLKTCEDHLRAGNPPGYYLVWIK